jgi:hypothetical protein
MASYPTLQRCKKDILSVEMMKQNICFDRARVKLQYIYAKFYLIIVPNNEETKEKPPFLDGYWYKTSRILDMFKNVLSLK